MELGLGIHGEPGRIRTSVDSAAGAVASMVDLITKEHLPLPRGAHVALVVNNLGGTSLVSKGTELCKQEHVDHEENKKDDNKRRRSRSRRSRSRCRCK